MKLKMAFNEQGEQLHFRWDADPEVVATELDLYKLWRNADLWKREGMFAAETLEGHITLLTNKSVTHNVHTKIKLYIITSRTRYKNINI